MFGPLNEVPATAGGGVGATLRSSDDIVLEAVGG